MIRGSTGYWSENCRTALIGAEPNYYVKDAATYAASAVIGALILKSFIAGPLGLLTGAALGLVGASAAIKRGHTVV